MDIEELIEKRYSVRNYKTSPVEEEKIMRILQSGRMAPSAKNRQPRHFVVVTDMQQRKRLNGAFNKPGFHDAPVVIAVCGDRNEGWHRESDGRDHLGIDVAIAADHMILTASELGLGSCWVCNFDISLVRDVLELPENIEPVVLIPLGYTSDENPPLKVRKSLAEIVHWNKY
ncbi:MAG: nitroreductase family protein [Bacteroidota bacterium]